MIGLSFLSVGWLLPGIVCGAVLVATEDNNTLRSAPEAVQTNGTSVLFKQASSTQSNSRTGFFKFDAAGLSEAVDGNTATLSLTLSVAAPTNFTLAVYVLNAGEVGYDWTEGTLTWNNSPGRSTTSTDYYLDPSGVQLVQSGISVPNGTSVGSKVTVSLTNWSTYLQDDDSLTFIVVATDQGTGTPHLSLASSEHATGAYRPTLTIVPEPGSLALVGLGALAVLRRRR